MALDPLISSQLCHHNLQYKGVYGLNSGYKQCGYGCICNYNKQFDNAQFMYFICLFDRDSAKCLSCTRA